MPRPRIVTDSSVRFSSPDLLSRHPVTLAPVTIRRGEEIFEDHPATELADAWRLFEGGDLPPVSEPTSVEGFVRLYEGLQRESTQIVSIHTSSGLSRAFENARQASQQFLGRCNVQVIDSQTLSIGLGLLVQSAAEAAAQGAEFEELVRVVRGMIPRLYTVFFLDDMAYLERNGLVTRSQAILGNMLGVIPFLTMEDGKIVPMEKVRNRPRAVEKLVEFVSEFSEVDALAVLQNTSVPGEETRLVLERLHALHPRTDIQITSYGPSAATFVGLNSLGVVVLETEEEVA